MPLQPWLGARREEVRRPATPVEEALKCVVVVGVVAVGRGREPAARGPCAHAPLRDDCGRTGGGCDMLVIGGPWHGCESGSARSWATAECSRVRAQVFCVLASCCCCLSPCVHCFLCTDRQTGGWSCTCGFCIDTIDCIAEPAHNLHPHPFCIISILYVRALCYRSSIIILHMNHMLCVSATL